jgi:hypothetical protein
MATGYPYEKVPLDKDKNEIRVLSFAARKKVPNRPLKFSFKTTSLHANPPPEYYAISYTWGNSDIRREIIIDGHAVSVPQNTEEALRRLCRHKPRGRIRRMFSSLKGGIVLWIDAVCINQGDVSERSWQVAMMGKVYSTATQVLIWLGHGGNGEKESVAIVNKLAKHCRYQTGGLGGLYDLVWTSGNALGGKHPQYGDIFQSANLPGLEVRQSQGSRLPLADAEIQSFFDFFSAPWFTRIWAVQEVILGKRPVCYFGEHSIPA